MSFMEPQITKRACWWLIDGPSGTEALPVDDIFALEPADLPDKWETIEQVTGYGARLSAPGYLDCTEWAVFDTVAEAESYLSDLQGED